MSTDARSTGTRRMDATNRDARYFPTAKSVVGDGPELTIGGVARVAPRR